LGEQKTGLDHYCEGGWVFDYISEIRVNLAQITGNILHYIFPPNNCLLHSYRY
jgi:hypothetical protein